MDSSTTTENRETDIVLTEKGLVKWFNDAKGFGFITHESGKDVFVHHTVIMCDGFRTLKDGEEVEYSMITSEKGLHATKVRRVTKLSTVSTTTDKEEDDCISESVISGSTATAEENSSENAWAKTP